jgi:Glu-tRNA(Gln) amidotransferase subunit E-like FAD-binding protein
MGQVMKVLIPKVKGRAQGKVVSEMVRRLLSQSAEASPTPSESGPVED